MFSGVACLELNNSPENGYPEFDIVFVHGLSSDALAAWQTATGDIWPTWIRQTIRNSRVALLNYPAPALFYKKESAVSIKDRGRNLADFLPTIGVGRRPTIFVCHSLGGLVIKEILRNCIEHGCSIELAANTIGLIYLATPHSGANLANLGSIVGSQLTVDLQPNSPYLLDLRDWFSSYAQDRRLFVSAYAETQSLYGTLVVDRGSSDPGVTGCVCIPLDADHSSICKPASLSSDVFQRVRRDIESAIGSYEKMTASHLVALDDILALPSLTNNMFFDILNFLNRELSTGSERGIIISNPCGGPRPSCIIVSEHESVISKVRPLQNRWPDRFKVEVGLLGEFTEEEEEAKQDFTSRTTLPSKVKNTNVSSHLAAAIAEYVADQVVFDVKVSTFWKEKAEIYFVAALHTLEAAVRRSIEQVLNSERIEGDDRRRTSKRLSDALSRLESLQAVDRSETIAESFKCLYQENRLSFRIFSDESFLDRKRKNYKVDPMATLSVRTAKLDRVLHNKDAFVFCAHASQLERDEVETWTSANNHLMWASSERVDEPLEVGSKVKISESLDSDLTIESLNQTVFFPMVDKVTSLHSVVVISGARVEKGSSGSTVFRGDGRPFAMLIGRTFQGGECKALAVTIDDIVSSSRNVPRPSNRRFSSEEVEGFPELGGKTD